jgi:hypothetical protein
VKRDSCRFRNQCAAGAPCACDERAQAERETLDELALRLPPLTDDDVAGESGLSRDGSEALCPVLGERD